MTTRETGDASVGDVDPLEVFYGDVAEADLQPLWTQHGLLPATPPIADVAYRWRWEDVRRLAVRAGELVPIDRGGDRRVLALSNPGLGGLPFASRTLWAAIQYLGAGESAPAHRHTPAAIRFVIEGEGVWTLVDGDPVVMAPGDLVLTPAWCWHEHHSTGDAPMLWFDGLDLPMTRALDAVFFELGPDRDVNRAVDPVSRSEQTYAAAGLVPDGSLTELSTPPAHSPLYAYRWRDTDQALSGLLDVGGTGYAAVRYADPLTGRDVLPTLRCSAHRVQAGGRIPGRRRVGSSVWVLYEGAGRAIVAGTSFELARGDMFVVPSWAPFELEADATSTLFAISDAPVLEAVHLSREEALAAPQDVVTRA